MTEPSQHHLTYFIPNLCHWLLSLLPILTTSLHLITSVLPFILRSFLLAVIQLVHTIAVTYCIIATLVNYLSKPSTLEYCYVILRPLHPFPFNRVIARRGKYVASAILHGRCHNLTPSRIDKLTLMAICVLACLAPRSRVMSEDKGFKFIFLRHLPRIKHKAQCPSMD
jgi:hypothetical protein